MKPEQVPTARVRGPLPPHESRSDGPPESGYVVPLYALYSPGQVALATFLGTPLAGCWLMARNFKKLGSRVSAWAILALGVAWTAGLCGLAMLDALPGVVSLGSIPACVLLMRGLQGSALDRHHSLGGKPASWGYAVLGSLVCLAIVFAVALGVVLAYVFATSDPGVSAPHDSEVLYADGATEADAIRLRDALAKSGYFSGPSTVRVQRAGERWIVSYVVNDQAARDLSTIRDLGDLSGWLSHEVFFDQPVDTILLDDESVARAHEAFEHRLQTLTWGSNEVQFRELTSEQARAIGDFLVAREWFSDAARVVRAERRFDTVQIELEVPPNFVRRGIDDLIYPAWAPELSAALGGTAVDLVLGDLEGKQLATYRWGDHPPAPVTLPDQTMVFYRGGATAAQAEAVAGALDAAVKPYRMIVEPDRNDDSPRIAVTLCGEQDNAEQLGKFHELADPLSKALGGVPVDIRVADDDLATLAVLTWEKRPKPKRR